MKFLTARTDILQRILVFGEFFFAVLFLVLPAHAADNPGAQLFHDKCAACHGADGTADTPVGKALKIESLLTPEVQKKTDAELMTIIEKGKNKMPAYGNTLKPDQIKTLVAYMRELAKKKK
jgi:mono/diheme cytochrome c family protein